MSLLFLGIFLQGKEPIRWAGLGRQVRKRHRTPHGTAPIGSTPQPNPTGHTHSAKTHTLLPHSFPLFFFVSFLCRSSVIRCLFVQTYPRSCSTLDSPRLAHGRGCVCMSMSTIGSFYFFTFFCVGKSMNWSRAAQTDKRMDNENSE